MAVDLGGEFLKVSIVKPGRTPISIVTNEMSKRRTSAQLAFIEGDRLLGEEAAALAVRYPDRVYARCSAMLCSMTTDMSMLETLQLGLPQSCAALIILALRNPNRVYARYDAEPADMNTVTVLCLLLSRQRADRAVHASRFPGMASAGILPSCATCPLT